MQESNNTDILEIYRMCRDIVDKVEKSADKDGKVDESLLPPLTDAFNHILEAVKIYLTTANDVYYGLILMSMDIVIDYKIRGAVDIKVVKEPFVFAINPLFAVKYTFSQFVAKIVQEIFRLTFDHPSDYARLNPHKDDDRHENLEKAGDASVSDMIINDVKLEKQSNRRLNLPPDSYTSSKMSQEAKHVAKKNESLDYNLKFIERFIKNDKNSSGGQAGMGSGQGNAQGVATSNNNNGQQVHKWEDNDASDTSEKIKSFVRDVWKNMSEKHRGEMPAGLVEQIELLLKPPQITWKQYLRKLIGTIPYPHRSTKLRINRRQPLRADLPGRLPKRLVKIVVVIDTSGSMSNQDIEYCLTEVFNMAKAQEAVEITVIECDAQINKVYKPKRVQDIQTKVAGRGGTAFTPAIEFINKDKYFRDALMVYFTDGGGESSIPKPLTYKNLWVVLKDKSYLSVSQPYGEVMSIHSDKNFRSY